MQQPIISPSLLSANFNALGQDIEMINQSQADWFHLDIMDGSFVPNISFGFPIIEHVKKMAQKPLDVHLMIVDPDRYIAEFKRVGADYLTVHYEACTHLHRTIQNIKANGMKAGVSLNPHTSVSLLEDILPELDLVLIMSVNPGFGGQKFIAQTYRKIEKLAAMAQKSNPNLIIEVDGGVDSSNAEALCKSGATALVAGNFIFKSAQPKQTISDLKHLNFK
jgi:ribulose-phosphate 3-epimerase